MSDPRAAEEGRTDPEKEGDNEKEEEKKEEATPDNDKTAMIEKIAEQFTTDEDDKHSPKDTEQDIQSTDDESEPLHVEVEEVQVEQVFDRRFHARVERVAKQAEAVHSEHGNRRDTLFYKIVLAGNVRVVSHVLDFLQDKEKQDVVSWLLMKGKRHRMWEIPIKNHMVLQAMRLFTFAILAFMSFIASPVFYVIHSFTTSLCGKEEHRLAANIQLPLAFAAFSQDEEMMQFFLSKGVGIKNSDSEQNNVFHYIADLSSESRARALEVFTSLVKFINDRDVVKQLLVVRRNSAGLTAMEYCAKYGSPQLLIQMMNHPGLIQHTAFAAGKEDISFGNTETEEDKNDEPVEAITKLEFVDVSMYEAGLFTNLSTLLNLLSDRDITSMSKEDLSIFDRAAFVGKWMSLKTKQTFFGILFFNVFDILVTITLILVLVNGLGSNPYIAQESNAELQVMLQEIHAYGQNSSYIFKDNTMVPILNTVREQGMRNFLKDNLEEHKYDVYTMAAKRFPIMDEYYNSSIENFTLTDLKDTPVWVIENLFQAGLELPEFEGQQQLFLIFQYFLELIDGYTLQLMDRHPLLLQTKVNIANREFIVDQMRTFYENFTIKAEGMVIQPNQVLSFWEFQQLFCINKAFFKEEDLKETDLIPPPQGIYKTSCGYQAMMELANKDCGVLKHEETYAKIAAVGQQREAENQAEGIFNIIFFIACAYIILDILERFVFIYTSVSNHTNALDMVTSVLSKKVPGSYPHRQFNMVTYLAFVGRFIVVTNKEVIKKTYGWSGDEVQEFGDLFMVVGLVFRFIMHIHSLRLLPGIGNFVITTFMMGTNLIHFSAVYGAVVFIFAIIFHILIDDPNCPVTKTDGFGTIHASMFSIFKLTFGHGDFEPYYTTTPVALTYTLYTVIVGLLLMNLIIAIMSTTATDIMTEPWKEVLWRIEWLDEALSVEFTFEMLTQPFKKFVKIFHDTGMWSHKRAGFQVIQVGKGGHYRVFIEVFRCKALEKDED